MPEGAQIRGICTTGYGADLAASVLGTPLSEVETVAHLRAATFLDPKTTYVIRYRRSGYEVPEDA